MYKRFFYLSLSVLWMILIYSMSAKTASSSSDDSMFITEYIIRFFFSDPSAELLDFAETIIRKIAHFTEYAVLSILLTLTLKSFGLTLKKSLFAVAISFFYAISDEVHQCFVPGRACRIFDVFIDTLGAFGGYLICVLSAKIFKRKN